MSKPLPSEWRNFFCKVVSAFDPEQRTAMLEEIDRMLRKDRHHDVYTFGPLRIDIGRAEVIKNGSAINLTNLEFKLLRHLIERTGRPVSREELLRSVWGYNSGAYTRTVDMHVHDLRRKIERDAKTPELIITVKGEGYKFVAPG